EGRRQGRGAAVARGGEAGAARGADGVAAAVGEEVEDAREVAEAPGAVLAGEGEVPGEGVGGQVAVGGVAADVDDHLVADPEGAADYRVDHAQGRQVGGGVGQRVGAVRGVDAPLLPGVRER